MLGGCGRLLLTHRTFPDASNRIEHFKSIRDERPDSEALGVRAMAVTPRDRREVDLRKPWSAVGAKRILPSRESTTIES